MAWRTVATQPESFRFAIKVKEDVYLRVLDSAKLIEDDDYAPGVMADLEAAWDEQDHFTVELYNTDDGQIIESMSGMAGYGGPEAAACAAFFDYWASEFSDSERANVARRLGCGGASKGAGPQAPVDNSAGYDISLDGLGAWRVLETHAGEMIHEFVLSKNPPVVVRVFDSEELIEDDSYAPGVMDDLKKDWDSFDYFDVILYDVEQDIALERVAGLAGYGSPHAAACVAVDEFFNQGELVSEAEREDFHRRVCNGKYPAAKKLSRNAVAPDTSAGYDIDLSGLGAPVVLATRPRTLRLTYKLVPGHHAAAIRVFDSEELIFSPEYTPRTQAAMKAAWDAGDHYDVELYDPVTGELFEVLYNQAGYGSPAAAACAVMRLHWAPHEFEDSELGEMIEGGFDWPDGVLEKFYADMGCRIGSERPQGVPEEYRNYNLNGLGASATGPTEDALRTFTTGFEDGLLEAAGDNLTLEPAAYTSRSFKPVVWEALVRECRAFAAYWWRDIEASAAEPDLLSKYRAAGETFGYERSATAANNYNRRLSFLATYRDLADAFYETTGEVSTEVDTTRLDDRVFGAAADALANGARAYPTLRVYEAIPPDVWSEDAIDAPSGALSVRGYEKGAYIATNGPNSIWVTLPDGRVMGPYNSEAFALRDYQSAVVEMGFEQPTVNTRAGYDINVNGLGNLGSSSDDAAEYVILDNGGKTHDRYTIMATEPVDGGYASVYPYGGFSEHPFHPQGFGQHGELTRREFAAQERSGFSNLGTRITLEDLPPDARRFADEFIAYLEAPPDGYDPPPSSIDTSAGYDISLDGLRGSNGPSNTDIAEFSSGFFEALLWSSTADNGSPLVANYEVGDISKRIRDALERECAAFARRWATEIERGLGYDHAGHDFVLTRNQHGAGFWDGDWPVDGDVLTPGAQDYPSVDLYVGDDGKLYATGYELGAYMNYNGPHEVEVLLPDATYIGPFGSAELAYEAYRKAAVVDDVGWKPGTFVPADNSAGYDIELDGLRGASRHMIAAWANSLARASRYSSNAPQISEGSSKGTLLTWHRWNDSNGEWTDEMSVDDLWGILRQYYNDEHGAEDSDDSAGYDIDLDGLGGLGGADHYPVSHHGVLFKLFDNGGTTADRYTLICAEPCGTGALPVGQRVHPYAGFDERPSMPNGVGTTGEITEAQFAAHERTNFQAFGTMISLGQLPPEAWDFAVAFMSDVAVWCHPKKTRTADAVDDSAGYDIDLDGLRGLGGYKDSLAMLQQVSAADAYEFTQAFFATLLSTQVDDDGNNFDESYDVHDIDHVSSDPLRLECEAFVRRWHVEIARGGGFEAAGEDFAHVRNGDGGSFRNGGWADGDALQAAAEEYPEAELYDNNGPTVMRGTVLSVRNYERGMVFGFTGPREIKVMLPDATWIGPYSNLGLAKAAYDAAVHGATSDPDDPSAGYDIDLDGLRGLHDSTITIIDVTDLVGPPDCLQVDRDAEGFLTPRAYLWFGLSWETARQVKRRYNTYAAVTVELTDAAVYAVVGWTHRDPQATASAGYATSRHAGFDTETVFVGAASCERDVQEIVREYTARTGVIPTKMQAAELLTRVVATRGLDDIAEWRESGHVNTDTASADDFPDCDTTRTTRAAADNSAGYDIDLD